MARDFAAEIEVLQNQIAQVRKEQADEAVRQEIAALEAAGVFVHKVRSTRSGRENEYRVFEIRNTGWCLLVHYEKIAEDNRGVCGPKVHVGNAKYKLACLINDNTLKEYEGDLSKTGGSRILTCCSHGYMFGKPCSGINGAQMKIGNVLITE